MEKLLTIETPIRGKVMLVRKLTFLIGLILYCISSVIQSDSFPYLRNYLLQVRTTFVVYLCIEKSESGALGTPSVGTFFHSDFFCQNKRADSFLDDVNSEV